MKPLYYVFSSFVLLLTQSVFATQFHTEKWLTSNGARVIFYQAKEVPMLDVSLAFNAGSAQDQQDFGLSNLTAQLLNQGNAGLDATAIAEKLADSGAQFGAENSKDMVVFNLRTLTTPEALQKALGTFSTIINHPDFPKDALEMEKKQLLMAIEQTKESPDEIANQVFFKKLYQNHPYAHAINGNPTTLASLNRDKVVRFYKQFYVANNAILVMVGDIDSKKAHALAEQLTKEMPKGNAAISVPKAEPLSNQEKIAIDFPSSQTIIRLGQLGISHEDPNYFPLLVGNYILGGGSLVSRLSQEVREKRALTYGVSSEFAPMFGQGPFLISLSTKNKEADNALAVTQDTLQRFINEGPGDEELAAAKQFITGSYPLSLASNRSIATLLLRAAFYHLPDNYLDTYVQQINAVTKEQIQHAFQQQLHASRFVLIKVGQA